MNADIVNRSLSIACCHLLIAGICVSEMIDIVERARIDFDDALGQQRSDL